MLAVQVREDAVLVLEAAKVRALRRRLCLLLRRRSGAESPCEAAHRAADVTSR